MKRLIAILTVLSLFLTFSALKPAGSSKELKWLGFNEGITKAKKDKKIALVDMYTDWCGWCKRMDRDTYTVDSIISRINKDFVAIKFNPELPGTYTVEGKQYTGPQLMALMSNNQSTGYPTTFFIDQKKNVIYAEAGYMGPESFSQVLDNMVSTAKK